MNIYAQAFLTEDFPEYAYRVKLQSQHTLFNHDNYETEATGIYNLSSSIPLSHTTSFYFNIPFQAFYNTADRNTLEFGDIEFSLHIRTLNKKKRSSVYSMGMLLPLYQKTNPYYYGWNYYPDYYPNDGILYLPPASSCLTDFPRQENYITGYGATKISYAFHLIHNKFLFMARLKSTIMVCKRGDQPDVGPWIINAELKGGYMIGDFTVILELLNTFFTSLNDDYHNNDLEDITWWTGSAGFLYDLNWFEAGAFFQLNMNHDLNRYAPYIIGVQVSAKFDKKEAYLKVK